MNFLRIALTAGGLLACGSVATTLLSGCTGAANARLGTNSRAELRLNSPNARDLILIVAPKFGQADAPDACTNTKTNFGCTQSLAPNRNTIRFTTNSEASASPFYVYVRNTSPNARTAQLEIFMDGKRDVNIVLDLSGNETRGVARIFRNNADDRL
jgi:hypothetical protein